MLCAGRRVSPGTSSARSSHALRQQQARIVASPSIRQQVGGQQGHGHEWPVANGGAASSSRVTPPVVDLTRTSATMPTMEEVNVHSPESLACPHPDAVRRRQEAETHRRQASNERRKQAMLETLGLKWFEGHQPQNMSNCRSADDYRAIVKRAQTEGRLLVTKFFTEDCYVCRTLYPKMKRIAQDNPDVLWAKLNGTDPTLVPIFQAMGIKKVPYFHMVFDGQLVSEMSVSLSTEKLSKFRAELAAHKRPQARTAPCSTAEGAPDAQQQQERPVGMEWA